MKHKFPWTHILLAAILAVGAGSALGYTYTVMRDDIGRIIAPSYTTIIPTDSPLRNTPGTYGGCNGGFSPNPCVGHIPEPGTYALIGIGLFVMLVMRRGKNE